ncbi:MAG TPA: DUF1566 domain-containing protein, partial [Candidatus Anammoximicrobium sp.]|nr:DUF1566 domain-containing protein [Candidatus Anammoximicrobium sp.]
MSTLTKTLVRRLLGRSAKSRGSNRRRTFRRLGAEMLEDRRLLAGILSVVPSSATQGTSNLAVTVNLDTSATPPVPPAGVVPSNASIGTITGSALTHASQYVVTGTFSIPTGEAAGTKDVAVSFPGPMGTVTYSLAGGFTVIASAAPEIQVLDGTTDIPDGTGSEAFGSTVVGTAVSRTLTVKNLGTSNLTLTTPITVLAGFTVTSGFGATTLAAGASTTFTVRMDATTVGNYSGTLSFANNDSNENPFDFTVSGTVTATAQPEIQVLDGTRDIPDGTGSDSFGSTLTGTPVSKTFTVKNVGTSNLTLAAPITVPAGFSVTSSFGSTTLAVGASTSFAIRLDATAAGSYSGTLSFANNDSNENPFDFTISGTVTEAPAHTYTIVDTGQTKSYNATTEITAPAAGQAFYGQDAQYAGNQPSYTKSADRLTVYDNNTGLTWQDTPDTNGDGSITASDKLNWTSAQARPTALNAANYGGYSDWRLPTIKELYSLIDFRGTDPSGLAGSDTSGLTPFIDRNYFDFAYGDTSAGERIIDSQYASSTLYVGDTSLLFGVNFADGRIKGYGLTLGGADKTFFVQCVRGNTSYGVNNFTANGDGTVTDSATGLMWSQSDSGSGMNWENALAWVQTKNAENYLGHNDWRLPNVKELQSIVDYTRSPATTGSAAINPVFSTTQVTGENGQADYPWYWSGTTHAAYNGSAAAGAYVSFGKGWGYMNSSWVDVHGAGCQRSDPKSGSLSSYTYAPYGYYHSIAPQGDAIRIFNYVRLVRDAGAESPTLTVNVAAASVAENAGSAATTVTISRNTNTTAALTVNLSSSDTTEATVPATVTIPAGQSSVTVTLAAVDDAIVDGTQTVTITASATGFSSGSDTLQVTDNDAATLTVNVVAASVAENAGSSATTVTISRNTNTTAALTV